MKRTTMVACVTLGFAGIAAAADTVTLYGVIDLSMSLESNGAGRTTKMESGVMNGSRVGMRGVEDLGSGYSTLFTLEMGVNADDGTSGQGGVLFGRQAFVGLSGGFGTAKLGRQYSPIYTSQLNIDPFIGGMKGDMTGTRGWFNSGNFRVSNAVTYQTPTWGGLQISTLYGFGEVAGISQASRQIGLAADYLKGPLSISVAYHDTKNATDTDTQRVAFAGAAYDLGPLKLHTAFDNARGFTTAKVRDYMLGVSAPLGTGRLMASVISKDNRAATDADARQFSIGYRYDLSKRTSVYTSYAQVHNDPNAGVAAGGVNGHSDKVFDVGLRHAF